ncbi:MAG: transglycosylase SLT domain-containing protein [Thermodesulfobacteriota bacterium]|nr:transglycosylase SLT domain-containing protein [Thermodesulfobacteriota bacterium]
MRKVILVFSVFLISTSFVLAETSLEPSYFPSLISSIRIKTPLSFCDEEVPLDNREVLERLEKEILITLSDRTQVILWIKRSNRYMPYIEEILKENNLPGDLKYVAIIESALRPHAGSRKGAIGFWQFMKETGLNYGLIIDKYKDERRNIFASTKAAVNYFRALYADLGSWTLSAAAYNMGEDKLKSEIQEQKVSNYYKLYLSIETQRYILRIIAAKLILSDLEKYGFILNESDLYPPLQFDRIDLTLSQRVPIHIIAQSAGTYFKAIKDLNPELRGHYICEGAHSILVPKGSAVDFHPRFEKNFAAWSSENNERTYLVKKGDHLTAIAERFNVSLQDLLIWNNLKLKNHIHPGDRLTVYLDEKQQGKEIKK